MRRSAVSIASVVGARPQFIKAAMVSRAFKRLPKALRIRHWLVHTGQHFEREMSEGLFRDLALEPPAYALGLGGLPAAVQLGRMIEALTKVYAREDPDIVVVYGDTTSTLAGALAATQGRTPCAHVEAGLRSFNRQMPEETNRILTDHLAQWLFCPTQTAVRHLAAEGLTQGVHCVGDVMLDALLRVRPIVADCQEAVLKRWKLRPGEYYLATLHRAENTAEAQQVKAVFKTLAKLDYPTLLPLHPRTRNLLLRSGWRAPRDGGLRVVSPLLYTEMLALERAARAILTDSGGIQKEAYIWNVPCLTLRRETEWVETLRERRNRLVGTAEKDILKAVRASRPLAGAPNGLFGDGRAAERIVEVLVRKSRS